MKDHQKHQTQPMRSVTCFLMYQWKNRNVTQVLTMRGPNKHYHNHIQIGASKGVPVHVWTKTKVFSKWTLALMNKYFLKKKILLQKWQTSYAARRGHQGENTSGFRHLSPIRLLVSVS